MRAVCLSLKAIGYLRPCHWNVSALFIYSVVEIVFLEKLACGEFCSNLYFLVDWWQVNRMASLCNKPSPELILATIYDAIRRYLGPMCTIKYAILTSMFAFMLVIECLVGFVSTFCRLWMHCFITYVFSGLLFTKKTPSYQYRDSHYKAETVVRPS